MDKKRLKRMIPVLLITGSLLAILLPIASIGAQGAVAEQYTDFANGAQASHQSPQPVGDVNLNGLTIYTNRTVFDGDNPGLPVEDFEGNILPPNSVEACPPPLNEFTNDTCFNPGGVLPGLELDVGFNGGSGQYAVLTQGFLGVTSDVVGPNSFVDYAIWRFNPPVKAVGFDFVWPLGTSTVNIEIRDAGGAVIGNDVQVSPSFWGVYSNVPIGEIEIDDGGVGDLYDNLAFGTPTNSNIAISKSPVTQTVVMGGNANFTITVTNTGSVTLTNVTVSDTLVPDCDVAIGTMVVSATVSYGCTDVGVTTSYINVVTVTSLLSTGLPGPSAMDSANVTVLAPDINVTPTSVSSSQFTNEVMTKTFTIENTGNLSLNWTLDEAPSDCNSPSDVTWANASPTSGSTASGGNTNVDVIFDSTGLSPGVYNAKLCIDSDDPDEPTVEVDLTLTVVVADINLNPANLSSTQFMDEVITKTLAIENQGTGALTWSISEAASDCNSPGDVSWINVSPTGGTTNAGGSTTINVGFDSTGLAHGVHTAKLCIDSNDPDEPQVEANLTLTVAERPIIIVSTGNLSGTLAQNENMTQTLIISNTGDADLDWVITEGSSVTEGGCGTPGNLPWVAVSPSSGSTPPGNSSNVAVVFDATGLATGDYSGELCIASDAPDNPEVVVTLNLTVIEAEFLIYMPAVHKANTTNATQPPGLLPLGGLFLLPAAVFGWRRWRSQVF